MINIKFDNNKDFYDFEGLASNNYRINIINGIMDDGKTYGAKEHMINRFVEYGERSIWVMNNGIILEEELLKFKTSNEENNALWSNVVIKRNSKTGVATATFRYKDSEEIMTYFVSIGSITKVARDEKIKNIYYDEFNYLDTRTYNQQINKFQLLLSRNMRVNKIFLIGNATTLNIPLLFHFDIWTLPKEPFFEFDVGGFKGLFHNFKRTIERIEKKYENSISYAIMKKTGFIEHAFKNEYIKDNMAKIESDYLKKHSMGYRESFQLGENIFVDLYSDYQQRNFYVGKMRPNRKIKYCLLREFMDDGIQYAPTMCERIGYYFQMDRIWYENITIKQYFYNVIKSSLITYL